MQKKITRRQKDVSRLLRERKKLQPDKLKSMKNHWKIKG